MGVGVDLLSRLDLSKWPTDESARARLDAALRDAFSTEIVRAGGPSPRIRPECALQTQRINLVTAVFERPVIYTKEELRTFMELVRDFNLQDAGLREKILKLYIPRLITSSYGSWPEERARWCTDMLKERDVQIKLRPEDETISQAQTRRNNAFEKAPPIALIDVVAGAAVEGPSSWATLRHAYVPVFHPSTISHEYWKALLKFVFARFMYERSIAPAFARQDWGNVTAAEKGEDIRHDLQFARELVKGNLKEYLNWDAGHIRLQSLLEKSEGLLDMHFKAKTPQLFTFLFDIVYATMRRPTPKTKESSFMPIANYAFRSLVAHITPLIRINEPVENAFGATPEDQLQRMLALRRFVREDLEGIEDSRAAMQDALVARGRYYANGPWRERFERSSADELERLYGPANLDLLSEVDIGLLFKPAPRDPEAEREEGFQEGKTRDSASFAAFLENARGARREAKSKEYFHGYLQGLLYALISATPPRFATVARVLRDFAHRWHEALADQPPLITSRDALRDAVRALLVNEVIGLRPLFYIATSLLKDTARVLWKDAFDGELIFWLFRMVRLLIEKRQFPVSTLFFSSPRLPSLPEGQQRLIYPPEPVPPIAIMIMRCDRFDDEEVRELSGIVKNAWALVVRVLSLMRLSSTPVDPECHSGTQCRHGLWGQRHSPRNTHPPA